MSTTLFNVGKLDDLFTLENPVLQRLKRFSRKVDLCYKRFELFHFPSHSVSLHKTARAQTTGKYTLNKICIIIPREKLLFTKAAWSYLWRARCIGYVTMRVINASYAARCFARRRSDREKSPRHR